MRLPFSYRLVPKGDGFVLRHDFVRGWRNDPKCGRRLASRGKYEDGFSIHACDLPDEVVEALRRADRGSWW